jgi:hypothetical protein
VRGVGSPLEPQTKPSAVDSGQGGASPLTDVYGSGPLPGQQPGVGTGARLVVAARSALGRPYFDVTARGGPRAAPGALCTGWATSPEPSAARRAALRPLRSARGGGGAHLSAGAPPRGAQCRAGEADRRADRPIIARLPRSRPMGCAWRGGAPRL